jgi:hypothetical protein
VNAWPGSSVTDRPGSTVPSGSRVPGLRPSAWWYLSAVVVLVVGAATGVAVVRRAVDDIDRFGRDVTRYPVNERGTVTFDATGTYTLYFEGPASLIGPIDPDALDDQLDIRFEEMATGEPVTLEQGDQDIAGHAPIERIAIKTFSIDRPGDYLLEVRTSDFPSEIAFVSVGQDPKWSLVSNFIVGVWLIGAGAVCAAATAIGVGVSRGRSKRARDRFYAAYRSGWPA